MGSNETEECRKFESKVELSIVKSERSNNRIESCATLHVDISDWLFATAVLFLVRPLDDTTSNLSGIAHTACALLDHLAACQSAVSPEAL